MADLKPTDYLNDAKQFAHSAIFNWGTNQPESNAAIAAASANALISIAESLAKIAGQTRPVRIGISGPFMGMVVCELRGDKRCPHAGDLSFECSSGIKASEVEGVDHA